MPRVKAIGMVHLTTCCFPNTGVSNMPISHEFSDPTKGAKLLKEPITNRQRTSMRAFCCAGHSTPVRKCKKASCRANSGVLVSHLPLVSAHSQPRSLSVPVFHSLIYICWHIKQNKLVFFPPSCHQTQAAQWCVPSVVSRVKCRQVTKACMKHPVLVCREEWRTFVYSLTSLALYQLARQPSKNREHCNDKDRDQEIIQQHVTIQVFNFQLHTIPQPLLCVVLNEVS